MHEQIQLLEGLLAALLAEEPCQTRGHSMTTTTKEGPYMLLSWSGPDYSVSSRPVCTRPVLVSSHTCWRIRFAFDISLHLSIFTGVMRLISFTSTSAVQPPYIRCMQSIAHTIYDLVPKWL
ncbi:hypothetical protein BJ166DRAFT_162214 [Pestalotiopsis sp. NC0098]|nr:hypothetical protein BJ166DRAFT_162214 [Pestalotiopsis sp. NC0098]